MAALRERRVERELRDIARSTHQRGRARPTIDGKNLLDRSVGFDQAQGLIERRWRGRKRQGLGSNTHAENRNARN